MNKREFKNLTNKEKLEYIVDKATEIIISLAAPFAAVTLISMLTGKFTSEEYTQVATGATVIGSPVVYFGLNKLIEKMQEHSKKDGIDENQELLMSQEEYNPDREITGMTSSFMPEILEVFEENNPDLPKDDIMAINQFLYLINCNYFDELSDIIPELDREDFIREIITKISLYLSNTTLNYFDENIAEEVLKYCANIPVEMKKKITLEFKKSKVKNGTKSTYKIIRNDGYDEDATGYNSEPKSIGSWFNKDDDKAYQILISAYSKDDYWYNEGFGDPSKLDWDIEFLKAVVTTIIKNHRSELRRQDPDYSNYSLVCDYIFNAMEYALENGKTQVGQQELIDTFKGWEYLTLGIKLDTLNTIYDRYDLDYNTHPFGVKPPEKRGAYQKIINFKPRVEESN